jgi:hypothetical protein
VQNAAAVSFLSFFCPIAIGLDTKEATLAPKLQRRSQKLKACVKKACICNRFYVTFSLDEKVTKESSQNYASPHKLALSPQF